MKKEIKLRPGWDADRLHAEVGEEEKKGNKCHWSEDYGIWETECAHRFEFNADGPVENGFNYCPYCGGKLELV